MSSVKARPSTPHEEFRELASFQAVNGVVLSLYFGFDPAVTLTGDEVATRLGSLLEHAKRTGAEVSERQGHAARLAFDADLERARKEVLRRLGPASVACFADSADGLWRAYEVRGPLPDLAEVRPSPYLVPLVAAPAEERAIVAAVGRERGEIFELRNGRLEQVADLSEDQPRRHRDGHAWQQPSLERHVDELARAHLRRVATNLDALLRGWRGARLVLAGEQEHIAALLALLSQDARTAVAGVVHPEAHAGPTDLLSLALSVLERRRQDNESELVERWGEAAGSADRAVHGWADTLAAASDGRIELLLFRDGVTRGAFACRACGRASASAGNCPLDGQPLEECADGLDLAVRLTLTHGGEARAVRHREDLDPAGGIGALVRF